MACPGPHIPLTIALAQAVLERTDAGRVFSAEAAAAAGADLGLSKTHVYKLLSEMSGEVGLLERPRRGLYVMRPPLGGRDPVRPIAVAVAAVPQAVVAGQSALAHWGFLEQAPMHVETLVAPMAPTWTAGVERRRGVTVWRIPGAAFEYRRIAPDELFGSSRVRLDAETEVPMFDRERTIVEQFALAPQGATEMYATHGHALDSARLLRYAARVGGQVEHDIHRAMAQRLVAA